MEQQILAIVLGLIFGELILRPALIWFWRS